MVSINVLIITYNQHDVICRALDSVLCQRDWGLKEIVLCDDNSSDSNWEVIQSYMERFPQIIRAYRNESNIGIYGNLEKTIDLKGVADYYLFLSGDDALCDGFFQKAQLFIEEHNVDVEKDSPIISTAYQAINPEGMVRVFKNSAFSRSQELFRLKYRNMVSPRGMLISKKVMDGYQKIPDKENLVLTEELCDIQFFMNANKGYYIPVVASTYFSRIGVSINMKQDDYYRKYIEKYESFLGLFDLCNKDQIYTKMKILQYSYYISPSISGLLKVLICFFKSLDFGLGFNKMQFLISARDIVKQTFR